MKKAMCRTMIWTAILAVAAMMMCHTAKAQTLELSAAVMSQPDSISASGYGLGATYVYTKAHDNVHVVGTVEWQNHDGVLPWDGDVELQEDFVFGVGVRLTAWGAWAQGTINRVETDSAKPDGSMTKEGRFGQTVAVGYSPGKVGARAALYNSEALGRYYGVGLYWKF